MCSKHHGYFKLGQVPALCTLMEHPCRQRRFDLKVCPCSLVVLLRYKLRQAPCQWRAKNCLVLTGGARHRLSFQNWTHLVGCHVPVFCLGTLTDFPGPRWFVSGLNMLPQRQRKGLQVTHQRAPEFILTSPLWLGIFPSVLTHK